MVIILFPGAQVTCASFNYEWKSEGNKKQAKKAEGE
jgi:hypothetical protein